MRGNLRISILKEVFRSIKTRHSLPGIRYERLRGQTEVQTEIILDYVPDVLKHCISVGATLPTCVL